jgi:hypothetical protein
MPVHLFPKHYFMYCMCFCAGGSSSEDDDAEDGFGGSVLLDVPLPTLEALYQQHLTHPDFLEKVSCKNGARGEIQGPVGRREGGGRQRCPHVFIGSSEGGPGTLDLSEKVCVAGGSGVWVKVARREGGWAGGRERQVGDGVGGAPCPSSLLSPLRLLPVKHLPTPKPHPLTHMHHCTVNLSLISPPPQIAAELVMSVTDGVFATAAISSQHCSIADCCYPQLKSHQQFSLLLSLLDLFVCGVYRLLLSWTFW